MKKLLLSLAVLSAVAVTAQVGINTDTPEATLDIRAKEDQKGDLRIEGVEEGKSTQWLLIWDEKDQKVKRRSLLEIKRKTLNEIRIDYIREKQPAGADEIIKKIKQCAPENIAFDKHFGDGKHDFVYCAITVSEGSYNRTWLNLNLGAEYANINSPHFNPTVSKTGEKAHGDKNLYASLYQWQRASDGHEFRDSETTPELADTWTNTGDSAGKLITGAYNWIKNGRGASGAELQLWQARGVNNPCPSGYHVPTQQEWQDFHQAVTGSRSPVSTNQMLTQKKLPNLSATGHRSYHEGLLFTEDSEGRYWSSYTDNSNSASYMYFGLGYSDANASIHRVSGYSVRCIKDDN
ncbi:fibrobacter succinogenes major paralogous domain [Candidatus Ornithobacterium hominis]|uniref:Fibrobacter succinogenes major paralogous domain n=1 Tax=Candidatus Ornithobacterium hominis TaxID=2497989 RepID=A0A383U2I3_9FLAO|nr:FISUMP domain-containing protein [Candidatus Ornithobacterium hominis]MCT7905069.1 fibrobacter succinogenes major paralogous domain-containing protein [Candidatus Ornithobacterium hominis]SZD74094.1 fibrobacter succinogenes major paralogous domain [Candidatus Ornithobacterium hominis]